MLPEEPELLVEPEPLLLLPPLVLPPLPLELFVAELVPLGLA